MCVCVFSHLSTLSGHCLRLCCTYLRIALRVAMRRRRHRQLLVWSGLIKMKRIDLELTQLGNVKTLATSSLSLAVEESQSNYYKGAKTTTQ